MAKKKPAMVKALSSALRSTAGHPDRVLLRRQAQPKSSRASSRQKSTPYDPANDDYDVPAFNQPIETTKATAIYNMHVYWSKKPHQAIRQYIRHYTKPGDIVLDPFCGSGGTAVSALLDGRKAIAIDRSPAATFITKNHCTPVDPDELRSAFQKVKQAVQKRDRLALRDTLRSLRRQGHDGLHGL